MMPRALDGSPPLWELRRRWTPKAADAAAPPSEILDEFGNARTTISVVLRFD